MKEIKTLKDAKEAIKKHKAELEEEYGVKELKAFGSYARGENKAGSDIDLLIEFRKTPDLFRFIETERRLEEILGVKVDLVRKKAVRQELRKTITREAIPL